MLLDTTQFFEPTFELRGHVGRRAEVCRPELARSIENIDVFFLKPHHLWQLATRKIIALVGALVHE
jgi:hypothetical protein